METERTGYELSRDWFNFTFDNPEKIRPIHTAIYMFAIEHNNRLGRKRKFGFPSQMTMEAIGVKKHQTYIKAFRELVDWGFFILIQESKNQYSTNIISLSNALPKKDKALDKANIKHRAKQGQSTGQSKVHIDKQVNKETNKQINILDKELAKKFFEFSGEKYLFSQKKNKSDIPEIIEKWSDEFRKLREIDGLQEKQIRYLIDWLFTSESDDAEFWKNQILSPGKLRKKNKSGEQYWRVLVLKIKENSTKKKYEVIKF